MSDQKVFKSQGSYAHLMQGLKQQFPSLAENADSKLFQFMATTKEATWTQRMDYNLYKMMDAVPAERGGYYIPSDKYVSQSYATWMNSLFSIDLKKSGAYMALSQKVLTLENELKTMMSEALKKTYQDTTGEPFTAKGFQLWLGTLNENNLFVHPDVLSYLRKNTEYKTAQKEMEELKQRLNKDYYQALKDMEDESKQASIIVEGKNDPMKVPYVTLSGALTSDVSRWESADKNMVEIHINSEEQVAGMENSVYSSAIGKVGWWLGAMHEGEVTQELADEKYQLDIEIKGINTYDIQRGDWYKGQYVTPALQVDDSAMLKKETYFGPAGSLQLIPVSFLVIYKPTIRLTIHRDVYEKKMKSFIQANTLLAIFGMGFSAGAQVEKKLITKDQEIIIPFDAPTIAAPQIIGVTSIKKYL